MNTIDIEKIKKIDFSLKKFKIGKLKTNIFNNYDLSEKNSYLKINPYRFFIENKNKTKIRFIDDILNNELHSYEKSTIKVLNLKCDFRKDTGNFRDTDTYDSFKSDKLSDFMSCNFIHLNKVQDFSIQDFNLLKNLTNEKQKLNLEQLKNIQDIFIKQQQENYELKNNKKLLFEF